jgi:hypothetical protein
MKRLKIDISELEMAFDNREGGLMEFAYYLDLETGEVYLTTHEDRAAAEELSEIAEQEGIDFERAVAQSDLDDESKEGALVAARVEERLGVSIVDVPSDDSSDAFRDMADFTETVSNSRLRERLLDALNRNRPFRRFKDALSASESETNRWYAFSAERVRERIKDWLAEYEVEPIED